VRIRLSKDALIRCSVGIEVADLAQALDA